ncbi:hypothetical protein [Sorangium sp. So ce693]|uniref:hypothetical protein n=1 Tax=Sorangium sp. So ce693 TaxID=3133318 RepID=UPI003F600B8B
MRLAHTLRCVSEAQRLHFAQESDEVGRRLGGWLCTAHPREAPPVRRPYGPDGVARDASDRVIRGGSFNNDASSLLSSTRNKRRPVGPRQ